LFPQELSDKQQVVFYEDEARFGRHGSERHSWTPPKLTPICKSQFVRESLYALTALSPQTGDCYSILSPYCNTEAMNTLLQSMSKHYKDYRMILIMDKAAWHLSSTLILPSNIKIIHLPPYSPQLNPVELHWRELRRKHFDNVLYNTLDQVEARLEKELKQLHKDSDTIKSLSKNFISF
jgi:transposase